MKRHSVCGRPLIDRLSGMSGVISAVLLRVVGDEIVEAVSGELVMKPCGVPHAPWN